MHWWFMGWPSARGKEAREMGGTGGPALQRIKPGHAYV